MPTQHAVVAANSTATISVGPLSWRADEGSYWTPNVPYRADYTAQLHDLGVTLTSRPDGGGKDSGGPKSTSEYGVRFGFRELKQVGDHFELNGVKVNFRGDSLQGANYDNIDHFGVSDAYDTLPGFLQPSEGNGGWPQAVRNYQRLNYNVVRIHQLPATPYMLDVADELGLMIQDETAIRGSNNRENFVTGRDNMVKHLSDLVQRDRNHASVLRWSQANEPQMPFFVNPGQGAEFDELLYQTVMALDTTRPISTDGDSPDLPHDNYTVFCHYEGDSGQFAIAQYTENVCDVPGKPNGQGEFIWYNDNTAQGMTWFATASLRMREKGAEDTRPYTLLSNWSSVIPGVKRTDFSSLEIGYPAGPLPLYGEDNLPDPWSNAQIQLLQKAFNPVAAVDTGFWDQNKLSNGAGEWPVAPSVIAAGENTRTLTVFNDTFTGTRLEVTWSLRQGAPDGAVVASGSLTPDIAPGDHAPVSISFTAPVTTDLLYLDIRVEKPGQGVLSRTQVPSTRSSDAGAPHHRSDLTRRAGHRRTVSGPTHMPRHHELQESEATRVSARQSASLRGAADALPQAREGLGGIGGRRVDAHRGAVLAHALDDDARADESVADLLVCGGKLLDRLDGGRAFVGPPARGTRRA